MQAGLESGASTRASWREGVVSGVPGLDPRADPVGARSRGGRGHGQRNRRFVLTGFTWVATEGSSFFMPLPSRYLLLTWVPIAPAG